MASHRFFFRSGLAVLGVLLAIGAGRVMANAPAPALKLEHGHIDLKPVKLLGNAAPLVIRRDAGQPHSRIVIPRKYLPLEVDLKADQSLSRPRTTSAGLLLATLLSGGGLTVVFARRRNTRAAVSALTITLVLTVALSTAFASPPANAPNAPAVADKVKVGGSQIVVEIVEQGNEITLILGSDAPQTGP